MGMAASQARYLSLTARKSNVEYQGQQINQERTTLATESANLYQQMMDLKVPTPPNTSDFYKTAYGLEFDETNYSFSNYKRTGPVENQGATVTYTNDNAVIFSKTELSSKSDITGERKVTDPTDTSKWHYEGGSISLNGSGARIAVSWLADPTSDENFMTSVGRQKNSEFYTDNENKELGNVYTYSSGGTKYYLSQTAYEQLAENATSEKRSSANSYSTTTGTATDSVFINGTFETAANGRLSTFNVTDGKGVLGAGKYVLSISSTFDEDAYNEADKDYKYQKDLYEKRIDEINAETAQVQSKDKTLELQLNQLDTEQNAIQTEMESVQKVIEKNVQDTFNIFA